MVGGRVAEYYNLKPRTDEYVCKFVKEKFNSLPASTPGEMDSFISESHFLNGKWY